MNKPEKFRLELKTHSDTVISVDWLKNSNKILSASKDGNIIIWNCENGFNLINIPPTREVVDVTWKPSGEKFMVAFSDSLKIWTLGEKEVYSIALSNEGNFLAVAYDNLIDIWCAKSHKIIKTLKSHQEIVTCLAWSLNEKMLANKY